MIAPFRSLPLWLWPLALWALRAVGGLLRAAWLLLAGRGGVWDVLTCLGSAAVRLGGIAAAVWFGYRQG
jgi:hypothetical protein